jgi:hypothetical protein
LSCRGSSLSSWLGYRKDLTDYLLLIDIMSGEQHLKQMEENESSSPSKRLKKSSIENIPKLENCFSGIEFQWHESFKNITDTASNGLMSGSVDGYNAENNSLSAPPPVLGLERASVLFNLAVALAASANHILR